MPQDLSLIFSSAPLEMAPLLFNIAVGVILAIILRFHFTRFGSTLSNREEFAQVYPSITATVTDSSGLSDTKQIGIRISKK